MSEKHAGPVDGAIFVDEVGIEYAILGDYRVRTAYRPVFALDGPLLRPVAVEGAIAAYLAGRPAPDFLAHVAPDDASFIDVLGRTLHLRNHRNIGVDGLDLFISYRPRNGTNLEESLREIRAMVRGLADIDLAPRQLVCEIAGSATLDRAALVILSMELREHGMRVALGDFGGDAAQERFDLARPDIVRIDGAWFRTVCRQPATVRLFGALVAGFRGQGASVLVEGIEDAGQLGVALDAGADLFGGRHLAGAALVGTAFDEKPLDIAGKLGDARVVRPLRR